MRQKRTEMELVEIEGLTIIVVPTTPSIKSLRINKTKHRIYAELSAPLSGYGIVTMNCYGNSDSSDYLGDIYIVKGEQNKFEWSEKVNLNAQTRKYHSLFNVYQFDSYDEYEKYKNGKGPEILRPDDHSVIDPLAK